MSMFQTPTRVWANAHPEYPGLFEIHSDSGDIALNQVATRQTLEALRASINDVWLRTICAAKDDGRRADN